MFILGIETSCDETAAAVLKDGHEILSNIVLSQDELHAPYGGVVPELASRQHIKTINWIVEESLSRAGIKLNQIDVFAVTQGPGLIGSLLVGLSFAKGLAYHFQKPLIGVDHLQAHIEAAFLEYNDILLPVLALVVSGGHTSLFFIPKKLTYQLIGKTRDDAAGEALDKIAKFLEIGYPGGPIIDKLSEKGETKKFKFSLPKMSDESLDFSFSGLKTAALKYIKQLKITQESPLIYDFLASFQQGIINSLLKNVTRALRVYQPRSLIICGGVARNRALRKNFQAFSSKQNLQLFIPSPKLCSDNAAMVAALGYQNYLIKKDLPLDLDAYPRIHSLKGKRWK
ncbi:MAG: tRNA (adenosine(37)-N6)-threonylcarbamoyltransferase complex transferase subunit TsaD [Candidatus Aminicenantia bacterium]